MLTRRVCPRAVDCTTLLFTRHLLPVATVFSLSCRQALDRRAGGSGWYPLSQLLGGAFAGNSKVSGGTVGVVLLVVARNTHLSAQRHLTTNPPNPLPLPLFCVSCFLVLSHIHMCSWRASRSGSALWSTGPRKEMPKHYSDNLNGNTNARHEGRTQWHATTSRFWESIIHNNSTSDALLRSPPVLEQAT
jgi:hypothetical protein